MAMLGVLVAGLVVFSTTVVRAATIYVVPTDSDVENYTKIEAAQPGDEVIIAPGTYRFRVYLEGVGTAAQPIVIRAEDPNDRPVWDLEGETTGNWPGSYNAGDAYRAIWQVTGSYYTISGIVFRNGTDGGSGDSGGLRMKFSDHLTLHDCLYQGNDNGLQGAGKNTVVEFCEFDANGLSGSTDGSHNLYIHGGDITVRYSYIHDAQRSQNMHIRANRAVFEYNWIARSMSYMGDMMPCTMDPCDDAQYMVLRGNVIVRGTPLNDGQVFVMHNDQGDPNKEYYLLMVNNTIIGNGDTAALVHFSNENPTMNVMQSAVINNNVIYNLNRIFRVDNQAQSNWSANGSNNWLSNGTLDTDGLQGSVTGTDPGFTNQSTGDYVPSAGSPLIGAANDALADLPDREYVRDLQWRVRDSVFDIGAFESTSTGDAGSGDAGLGDPEPDAGADAGSDAGDPGADTGADTAGADEEEPGSIGGGCGCGTNGNFGGHLLTLLILPALIIRRSRRPARAR
jgi:hypothetical protein